MRIELNENEALMLRRCINDSAERCFDACVKHAVSRDLDNLSKVVEDLKVMKGIDDRMRG